MKVTPPQEASASSSSSASESISSSAAELSQHRDRESRQAWLDQVAARARQTKQQCDEKQQPGDQPSSTTKKKHS